MVTAASDKSKHYWKHPQPKGSVIAAHITALADAPSTASIIAKRTILQPGMRTLAQSRSTAGGQPFKVGKGEETSI